jgi:hypothetical protein
VKLTRPKVCINVDNVDRALVEDRNLQDETRLTKVCKEERENATFVTTVSSHKGRSEEMMDGFFLAVVHERSY